MRVRRLTRFRAVSNRRGGAVEVTRMFSFGGLCLIFFLTAYGVVVVAVLLARRNRSSAAIADRGTRESHLPWALPARQPAAPLAVAGDCPVCGTKLPADSPLGLCPQCLLQC